MVEYGEMDTTAMEIIKNKKSRNLADRVKLYYFEKQQQKLPVEMERTEEAKLVDMFKPIPVSFYKEPIPLETLTIRLKEIREAPRVSVSSTDEVFKLLEPLQFYDREVSGVLLMDIKNKLIGIHFVGVGGVDFSAVDIRLVIRILALSGATGMIFFHNHPSGEVKPSDEDIHLLNRLDEICKVVGFQLVDFVIIGRGLAKSGREERWGVWGKT
jgi:DNA repair protein RadC